MSTGIAFEVRRARDTAELAGALRLRHAVFCVEQGVPEREELDGRDGEGIHLVAVSTRQGNTRRDRVLRAAVGFPCLGAAGDRRKRRNRNQRHRRFPRKDRQLRTTASNW